MYEMKNGHIPEDKKAHAPYNFVPLNKKVIKAEPRPDFDQYHSDKKTGYIDCKLETLTPLYIRDTLDRQQVEAKKESKDISDFFSPAKKIRIPGSSLRGMTRTLVEIVSFSKIRFVAKDKLFSFRALADQSTDLKKSYQNLLRSVKAGYIIKKNDGKYYIRPAKEISQHGNTQYFRIDQDKVCNPFFKDLERIENDSYRMLRKELSFDCSTIEKIQNEYQHYWKVTGGIKKTSSSTGKGWEKGWLICSGSMQKKNKHWIVTEPVFGSHRDLEIPADDIEAYQKACLTDYIKENNFSVLNEENIPKHPCFWVKKNSRYYFGHTPFFRVPYNNKLEAFIAPEHLNDEIDMAETIFGQAADDKKETFAGRVFFEDGRCHSETPYLSDEKSKEESVPQIIATPKPTTFQHYLSQDYEQIKYQRKKVFGLHNYNCSNSDLRVRGWKLYWHKKNEEWEATLKMKRGAWERFLKCNNGAEKVFISAKHQEKDEVSIDLNKLQLDDANKIYYKKLLMFVFGRVAEDDFKDRNLVSRLLKGEMLKRDDGNPDYVYFDDIIKNEKLLKDRLKQLDIPEIEPVLSIWRQTYQVNDTQHTRIRPIKEGVKFSFRVRFENLSNIELGALLFVLNLPEGCAHKLGMGKSLGLGSVRITTKLFTSRRNKRYKTLFSNSNVDGKYAWTTKEEKQDLSDPIKNFAEHITGQENLQEEMKEASGLWKTPRLRALRALLNFNDNIKIPNWNDRTDYMRLDEFKKRKVLPEAEEVIEGSHV